jgi:hypothetical protein
VVLIDELRRRRGRFLRLRLIVFHVELQLLAENAAGGVDLLEGHLDRVVGRDAERRGGSRQRPILPDGNLVTRAALAAPACREKSADEQGRGEPTQPHEILLLTLLSERRGIVSQGSRKVKTPIRSSLSDRIRSG